MMTQAIFYFFAAVAVLSAALCILQRNPVSAALWLVSTMFSLAAIYVLLDAQFIAAIQVLVYAGAIMVLFLFVIMLLNLGHAASDVRGPSTVAAAIVIVGLLIIELAALWRYTPRRLAGEIAQAPAFADPATVFAAGPLAQQEAAVRGVVGGIAAPLFQVYLVPFEITSVLLLAAIVGAVVLAKRKV
jgi:NADH-quinone oxidoreductase subunit J